MKLTRNVVVAASAIVITSIAGIGSTAVQAATEQCRDGGLGKVELAGDSTTVSTNLDPGTEVCIKAGNRVTYVTVDENGDITNSELVNRNGKAQGISHYVWYSGTTPPPS